MSDSSPSFEKVITQLQETIQKLEMDDLTLDESVSLFEEGQALTKLAQTLLEEATLRVEQLTVDGEIITIGESV